MTEEIRVSLTFYQCRFCRHIYKDEKTAHRCEDYCSSHDTYNNEIAKKGISIKEKTKEHETTKKIKQSLEED